METIPEKIERLYNEKSNLDSYKKEYLKGLYYHKENEPENKDPKDYEEEYEEDKETKTRMIIIEKPHAKWEEQLTNLSTGLNETSKTLLEKETELADFELTILE